MDNSENDMQERALMHMLGVESWLRNHGKVVRPELSKKQKQELKECFDLIDTDGSASSVPLRNSRRPLYGTPLLVLIQWSAPFKDSGACLKGAWAIDANELLTAFNVLGMHVKRSEVEKMLAEVDADGSGEVEYPEFVQIMTSKLETQSQEGDAEEKAKKQPLPFQLLAQAYRRKKLIEAVMGGDKTTQQRLRAKAEKAEAERQAVLASMEAEKHNMALRFDEKQVKTLSDSKCQKSRQSHFRRKFETAIPDYIVEQLDDKMKQVILHCGEEDPTTEDYQCETKSTGESEEKSKENDIQATKPSSLDKNVQASYKQELANLERQRMRVLHKPVLEQQLLHLQAIKSIQDYKTTKL